MNIWQNAVITEKGLSLQAKLIAGTSLTITRAVTGSGTVTAGMLQKQTYVTNPEQTITLSGVSYPEDGKCAVRANLKNDGLETGYIARQLGFYAEDPDEGEILYFIAQAESGSGTTVPSETEMPGYSAEWTCYFQYGQADNVDVMVDPANTISAAEAQQMVDAHANDTENPHGVTKEQLGLDLVDNTADSEKYVAYASTAGTGNKTKSSITVRFNGGSTEGTDMFTFNGSVAKSINITPAKIGAMPASRIHFSTEEPSDWVDGDIWLKPVEE